MPSIHRSARVQYSVAKMLALVNDIEAYPEFLHWCVAARIEQQTGAVVEAALEIGVSGLHKTMRTRNTTQQAGGGDSASIRIEMLSGPLSRLEGRWTFTGLASQGTNVDLNLEYETRRTPFGFVLRSLFDEIANSQLKAFIGRADSLFGHG